jgi:hypothetical protein
MTAMPPSWPMMVAALSQMRNFLPSYAVVAAIFQASGMTEEIERILQDREETSCLAADGSTPIGTLLMAF